MKNIKFFALTYIPFMLGMKDGVDGNTVNNFFKVLQTKITNFAQNRRPQLVNNAGTVAYLLSDRNRKAADFSIIDVKNDYEARNQGKTGFVATVRWLPPISMDEVSGGSNDVCETSGIRPRYRNHAYKIDRVFTSKPLEISDEVVRCIQEGKDTYETDSVYNYVRAVVSEWSRQVSAEIHNLANPYYGDYPNRFNGTQPLEPASKTVNLFRDTVNAHNEVNWLGETYLTEERMAAGIGEADHVYIGGTTGLRYAKLKELSVPNNDSGFDPSMLEEMDGAKFIYDDYMESALQVENPLMLIRDGALQIVTHNKHVGDFTIDDEKHKRGTIVDPFYGLTWDTFLNKEYCGDEITYTLKVKLYWGVWGYPDCLYPDDPLKEGVKDVMLYKIGCGDTPVCSEPVDLRDIGAGANAYDDSCSLAVESCESECNVVLRGVALANGDYQVTAIPTPKLGASIDTYAWDVNGTPVATPTPDANILVIPNGASSGGDVVNLTITDSTGCQASASLTIDLPNIQIQLQGAQVPNGDTQDFGTQSAGTPFVFPVEILNGGNKDLVVSAIVEVPTLATSNKPSTPLTVAALGTESYNVTFDSAVAGNAQIVITVASNDPDTPLYTVTAILEFT